MAALFFPTELVKQIEDNQRQNRMGLIASEKVSDMGGTATAREKSGVQNSKLQYGNS